MTIENQPKQIFDLEKRTLVFLKESIDFARQIPQDIITRPLIIQFIKSSSSIGANYHEANDAESKKDFMHKIGLYRKEAKRD